MFCFINHVTGTTSIRVCRHQRWHQRVWDYSGSLLCPKGSRTCDFLLWEGWRRVFPACVHDKPLDSKGQLDAMHCSDPEATEYTRSLFHLPYAGPHDWQSDGWTAGPVRQFLLLMANKDRDENSGEKVTYLYNSKEHSELSVKVICIKVSAVHMLILFWSNRSPDFICNTYYGFNLGTFSLDVLTV